MMSKSSSEEILAQGTNVARFNLACDRLYKNLQIQGGKKVKMLKLKNLLIIPKLIKKKKKKKS
jgi:hypothetical protein